MQARMTHTPSQRALECLRQSSECHEALKAQCCFSASHLLGVPEVSAASQARWPIAMLCISEPAEPCFWLPGSRAGGCGAALKPA